MNRWLMRLAAVTLALLSTGCATTGGLPIDTSRSAKGQDSRVLFMAIGKSATV